MIRWFSCGGFIVLLIAAVGAFGMLSGTVPEMETVEAPSREIATTVDNSVGMPGSSPVLALLGLAFAVIGTGIWAITGDRHPHDEPDETKPPRPGEAAALPRPDTDWRWLLYLLGGAAMVLLLLGGMVVYGGG